MADGPQQQKLTDEEFDGWVPTVKLVERATVAMHNMEGVARAVAPYLQNGLLRSGARNYGVSNRPNDPPGGVIEIENTKWLQHGDLSGMYDFWRTGTLVIQMETGQPGYGRYAYLNYFDVRFELLAVEKMLKAMGVTEKAAAAATDNAAKNKGGRPARDDWDDVLAATAGEMLGGRLIPKRAADVEKFMLQWASDKGKPLGDTAVKAPAKKLFEVFKKEVGN
jgi:hypothetical protein